MADLIGRLLGWPYRVGRKTLPIHTLESKEPKLIVSQNGYGISGSRPAGGKRKGSGKKAESNARSSQSHLLTSIGGCLMVHIPGSQEGVNVLAHLDPHIDHATALNRAMSHLVHEGIIERPSGTRATILTTPISAAGAVQRTALALQAMGFKPEITRCIPFGGVAGINNEGQPVRFAFTELSEQFGVVKDVGQRRKYIQPAIENRRLVFDNENRFVAGYEPFEIFPNVPSMVYREGSKNQPGAYGFNIPLDSDIDEGKLPRVAGVKVERMQTGHGQYIHVGASEQAGPLRPATIKKVQKAFYAAAKQIAKTRPNKTAS